MGERVFVNQKVIKIKLPPFIGGFCGLKSIKSAFSNVISSGHMTKGELGHVIEHVTGRSGTEIIIGFDVEKSHAKKIIKMGSRVASGAPLAYVLGYTYFYGRKFMVNKNVLIPRHDTETLVKAVLDTLRADSNLNANHNLSILDLCAGSGAVGVTLSEELGAQSAYTVLADISKKTINIARKNVENIVAKLKEDWELRISIQQGDMFGAVNKSNKFNVIVSNPPYIKPSDIGIGDVGVLREPWLALDGGEDGLRFYRIIAEQGRNYLSPHGFCAVEIGYDQGESVPEIFRVNGWNNVSVIKDLGGRDRVVLAR